MTQFQIPSYSKFADESNGAVSIDALKAWHYRFSPTLYEKKSFDKDRAMTLEELKVAATQYKVSSYDHIIGQPLNQLFEEEKAKLQREVTILKSQNTALSSEANAKKRALETKLNELQDEIKLHETARKQAEEKVQTLHDSETQTDRELKEVKSELARTDRELKEVKSELARTETELQKNNSSLTQTEAELQAKKEMIERLATCQKETEKLQAELTRTKDELTRTATELQEKEEKFKIWQGGKDTKIVDAVADSGFVFLFIVMTLTFILHAVFIAIYTQQKTLTNDFNFSYMNYALAIGVAIVRQGLRLGLGIASASEFRKNRHKQGYIGLIMTLALSIFESVDGFEMVTAYNGNLSFHMLIQGIIWSGTLAELRIVFNVIKE